jgi:hypothetical protein
MIVPASDQGKHEFCVAVLNARLHKNSICPANHDVSYGHGWFQIDDNDPFQDPELTAEAERVMKEGHKMVGYWQEGNCYILMDNPEFIEEEEFV